MYIYIYILVSRHVFKGFTNDANAVQVKTAVKVSAISLRKKKRKKYLKSTEKIALKVVIELENSKT